MNQKAGIYIIYNLKKDRCYIGRSINVNARLNEHFRDYKSKALLYNYKGLYQDMVDNIESFIGFVICNCEEADLGRLEDHYIKLYDSIEHGYNTNKGSGAHLHLTEDQRQHISNGMTGRVHSNETRTRMSESAKRRWSKEHCLSNQM